MQYLIEPAVAADVPQIAKLVEPYADRKVLIHKELVSYYEDIQEFYVARVVTQNDTDNIAQTDAVAETEDETGKIVACGALHVFWADLGEIRTLAVDQNYASQGIGYNLLGQLLNRARTLGLKRLFCLTFATEFFARAGFVPVTGQLVEPRVFQQMRRSSTDEGVAQFLDLDEVKPNTLGNTRMLLEL